MLFGFVFFLPLLLYRQISTAGEVLKIPEPVLIWLPLGSFGFFFLYAGALAFSRSEVRLYYWVTNYQLSQKEKLMHLGVCSLVFIVIQTAALSYVYP
jgi:hypothetical protein